MSYTPHVRCRACNFGPPINVLDIKFGQGDRLESVLNLGTQPLPNAFCRGLDRRPGHYPLELLVCPRCTLGQLSAVVDPLVMYSTYAYVTSTSRMMHEHFEILWECLNRQRKIEAVVEIGSNDGLMLAEFRRFGAESVLGIDPAENLVKAAKQRDVNTLCGLFNRDLANMAVSSMPPIDLVIARHVFCHVDDWQEFINNIGVLCHKETVVCIEVPHAHDMIQRCEWDTIYAEHLSYLTIRSMQYLLEGSALRLQGVLRFAIHGGSIGLILRRRDCETPQDSDLQDAIGAEHCSLPDWRAFGEAATAQIGKLRKMVESFRRQGKRIAGYGASAKSTVWVNACGFTRQDVEFITDDTPGKQYCTSPGTNIPITDPGAILRELPDFVILWSWNYEREILAKEELARSKGVKFIVPTNPIRIV